MENERLITVDPGRSTGLAFFEQGELVSALTLHDMRPNNMESRTKKNTLLVHTVFVGFGPTDMVIEKPIVYDRKRQKGDPNDLIKVSLVAGIFYCLGIQLADVRFVTPQQWKGQTHKSVDNKRTLKCLSPHEYDIAKNASNHVLDAIGIGLKELGRSY